MISLSFHGAVRGVTGSCNSLEVDGKKILIDCGMFQGTKTEWNEDDFGFDPKEVEAVLITHPHIDHVGRLPKLVAEGFSGKIYMPAACRPLSRLVLEDSAHILSEEAAKFDSEPMFTAENVAGVFDLAENLGYHELFEPVPGVKAMFHDAGHVLGSSFISIEVNGKTLVFSGDIGNDQVPILPDTEKIHEANVVVCESTYGDRLHEGREYRRDELKRYLEETISKKGVLLIPAFSIERTQEILYELNHILLNDLKTNVPIYLDSPMAIKATQTYRDFKQYLRFDDPVLSDPDRDFFSFPNLSETLRVDDSKAINDIPAPKVIIAGSGMVTGGRVLTYLKQLIDNPTTTVL